MEISDAIVIVYIFELWVFHWLVAERASLSAHDFNAVCCGAHAGMENF